MSRTDGDLHGGFLELSNDRGDRQGRAPTASPRLLVAIASYVQLMQELQAGQGSPDAQCKPRDGSSAPNPFPTRGWEGQGEAAAADAAVREHAEHEGRHRMDPLLSELSHRLVSCAAFRGDRGGIGAGSFRTDQPALIEGLFDNWQANRIWADKAVFLERYGAIEVGVAHVAYPADCKDQPPPFARKELCTSGPDNC